jgi:sigma-B regulation protein RsbU (phosphoserine phosphatase)
MAKLLLFFLQPRTLQQRNTLYILLPTLCVLLLMGIVSLLLVRRVLLEQWEQTAIAQMQRAAYQVDQRLLRPKRLLTLYQEQTGENFNVHVSNFLLERLRETEGVVEVDLEWDNGVRPLENDRIFNRQIGQTGMKNRRFHRMKPLEVTTPVYDSEFSGTTVSLVSEFRDESDKVVGRIEVKVSFFDLIEMIVKSTWWKSNTAFLLDQDGKVLSSTSALDSLNQEVPGNIFGTGSELERKTLEELQKNEYGTVFGKGLPPDEVSGYYRLHEAPWIMVLIAPGENALEPIISFKTYYFLTSGIGILLALILIRWTTTGTARSIRKVSGAAQHLANGNFSGPLEEIGRDEVSELTRNFNVMTRQLRERMHLQEAMSVAREVQQNLLPQSSYNHSGIDISGISQYCQETGGDYYDILPCQHDARQVGVVLGDVVGHGIGAALLMASIRSLVRCRTSLAGMPVEVIRDVNRLLCRDTEQSGNFVSLFYLIVDQNERKLHWVRCGHDPAIVYDPQKDEFSELRGEGLVLGFDSTWPYRQNSMRLPDDELIILIASDGVWEAECETGEQFGRERVQNLIALNWQRSSEDITAAITREITRFRGTKPQSDDITLVVVKTSSLEGKVYGKEGE